MKRSTPDRLPIRSGSPLSDNHSRSEGNKVPDGEQQRELPFVVTGPGTGAKPRAVTQVNRESVDRRASLETGEGGSVGGDSLGIRGSLAPPERQEMGSDGGPTGVRADGTRRNIHSGTREARCGPGESRERAPITGDKPGSGERPHRESEQVIVPSASPRKITRGEGSACTSGHAFEAEGTSGTAGKAQCPRDPDKGLDRVRVLQRKLYRAAKAAVSQTPPPLAKPAPLPGPVYPFHARAALFGSRCTEWGSRTECRPAKCPSESRVRENRTHGSMSGDRKRNYGWIEAPAHDESRRQRLLPTPTVTAPAPDSTFLHQKEAGAGLALRSGELRLLVVAAERFHHELRGRAHVLNVAPDVRPDEVESAVADGNQSIGRLFALVAFGETAADVAVEEVDLSFELAVDVEHPRRLVGLEELQHVGALEPGEVARELAELALALVDDEPFASVDELFHGERLQEVVLRARAQGIETLLGSDGSRQEKHRNGDQVGFRRERPRELEAARPARKLCLGDDEVWTFAPRELQRRARVEGRQYVEVRPAKVLLEDPAQIAIRLYEENAIA